MTNSPAVLRTALGGHPSAAPEWPVVGADRVPVEQFGKDHWSTFAYVETRGVDYAGLLNHDHMRADADRHPALALAGSRSSFPSSGHAKYPTRLCIDGQTVERPDHDDYDCLDDLVAAGLLAVEMPKVGRGQRFYDVRGRVIPQIDPVFVTGLAEQQLSAHAKWSLTERGQQVASELRAHKAGGGNFHQFTPATA